MSSPETTPTHQTNTHSFVHSQLCPTTATTANLSRRTRRPPGCPASSARWRTSSRPCRRTWRPSMSGGRSWSSWRTPVGRCSAMPSHLPREVPPRRTKSNIKYEN